MRFMAQPCAPRFSADGDALALPTRRLLVIFDAIREHLPAVRRVSSYCLPRNLRKKSLAEVRSLAAAGLKIVYVGAERVTTRYWRGSIRAKVSIAPALRSIRSAKPLNHPLR